MESGNEDRFLQIGGRLHFLGSSCMVCSIPREQLGRKTGTNPRTFNISNSVFPSGTQKSVQFALFQLITDAFQYSTKG